MEIQQDLPDSVTVRIKGCPQQRGQCMFATAASVFMCSVSGESETLSLESGGLSANPGFKMVYLLCSLGKLLKITGLLFLIYNVGVPYLPRSC